MNTLQTLPIGKSSFESIRRNNDLYVDKTRHIFQMVSASGIDARAEVLTCDGRIDLLMEFSDKIFIFEFKCNQSEKAAIKQIRKKGYTVPYQQTGKKIILMGINFDSEKRNVSEWVIS